MPKMKKMLRLRLRTVTVTHRKRMMTIAVAKVVKIQIWATMLSMKLWLASIMKTTQRSNSMTTSTV